jgi:hypothetical protein
MKETATAPAAKSMAIVTNAIASLMFLRATSPLGPTGSLVVRAWMGWGSFSGSVTR